MSFSDATGRAMEGYLHLRVFRNAKFVEAIREKNLITDAARPRIRALCSMACAVGESLHITHVGVGDGSEPAKGEDTDLHNTVLVPVSSATVPEPATARFGFVIPLDAANGLSIREFGLFCGDGMLFSKRVRSRVIDKDPDVSIFGCWDIHF
jgi:hypothetical protein